MLVVLYSLTAFSVLNLLRREPNSSYSECIQLAIMAIPRLWVILLASSIPMGEGVG